MGGNQRSPSNILNGNPKALRFFTKAQVAIHCSANDCWIVIDKKVYNVTKFLSRHPGTAQVLLKAAGTGRDVKEQFDAQGHSKLA